MSQAISIILHRDCVQYLNRIPLHEIIKKCIELIHVDDQDYWMVTNDTVWYSKYYGGGAYHNAFHFRIVKSTITIKHLKEAIEFDLCHPESFAHIGAAIRVIADGMFADRRPWR